MEETGGNRRGTSAVATGDVDGDGREEIAVGRNAGNNERWILYDDDGTQLFSGGQAWGSGRGVSAIAMGDVDGDGREEIAVGRNTGNNERWILYDDDGTQLFSGGQTWGDSRGVSAIAMGDVDGDDRDEIAVGRNAGNNERWILYDDDGTQLFSGGQAWGSGRGVSAIAMGDVDGDGREEIAVGRNTGNNERWILYDRRWHAAIFRWSNVG